MRYAGLQGSLCPGRITMLQKKYHGFFLDADNTLFD
ncbi:hypothetical protein LCGC14_2944680, partial [marine sediment metagenome]